MIKPSVVISLLSMAVALTACSPKSTEVNQPASSGVQRSPAHLGGTLDLAGERSKTLAVTLSRIINPATGTDGPPAGNEGEGKASAYVAAMLIVKNTGTAPIQDNANNDAVLVGSNNQDYKPDPLSVTECTNFNGGVYRLDGGESASGCVVFVMPPGVTPAKFKYTPASGFKSTFGEWLIP